MSPIEGLSDLARPSVYKFNNAIVFEHLQVPHIPYELDYVEVFITLCVQLSNLYEKLIHEECYSNSVIYDTIVRLDTRVKHHIINAVSKQITEVSSAKVKAGTRSLRQLAGSNIALKSTGSSANLSTGGASSNNGSIHGNPNLAQPSTNTSSAPSTSSTATTRNASPAPPASGKSTTASTIANATGAGIAGVAAVMTAEKEGRSSSAGGAAVSPQDTDNKDATNRSGSTVSVDNPIAAQHQRRSRRANVGVVSDASSAVSAAEKTESSAL